MASLTTDRPQFAEDSTTTTHLLRRVLVSSAGGAIAGVGGLALSLVIGRAYGTAGAGLFFSVVAVVTVLGIFGKVGTDTGVVWLLPRLRATGSGHLQRSIAGHAMAVVGLISGVLALATFLLAGPISELIADGDPGSAFALRMASPGILLGALSLTTIGATRGLGVLWPLVGIQNILIPAGRVLAALGLAAAGLSVAAALAVWSWAWLVAVLIAGEVIRRTLPRTLVDREEVALVRSQFWRFSAPRAVSSVLEVALVWADVLIVAALMGPSQAGIYAVLSRFVTTGTLGSASVRIAFGPRFSTEFSFGRTDRVADLIKAANPLLLTLTWPLFLIIAVLGSDLLALFGPGFTDGAVPLAILSAAMMLAAVWGPVQGALLMSGRSSLQVVNKSVALITMIGLDVLLIPRFGLVGAAIGWSTAMLVDTSMEALELRFLDGINGVGRNVLLAMVLLVAATGIGVGVPVLLGLEGAYLLLGAAAFTGLLCLALLLHPRTPMSIRKGGIFQ